jgi:hypothetical protein
MDGEISRFHLLTRKKAKKKTKLALSPDYSGEVQSSRKMVLHKKEEFVRDVGLAEGSPSKGQAGCMQDWVTQSS